MLKVLCIYIHLDGSRLPQLSCDEPEGVLVRKELLLRNENDLFDLTDNLSASDRWYSLLFRFIELSDLDLGHLDLFRDHIFPDLSCLSVWKGLCDNFKHTETRDPETKLQTRKVPSVECFII